MADKFIPHTIEQLQQKAAELNIKDVGKFIETQRRLDLDLVQLYINKEMEEKRLDREDIDKTQSAGPQRLSSDPTLKGDPQLDKSFKCLGEDEDLDYYLIMFETTATKNKIPKESWPLHLAYKLTDKLRKYMIMHELINNTDYEKVKTDLLHFAEYTEETYRNKWDTITPVGDDFREYYMKLRRSLDSWVKASDTPQTYEGLRDLILKGRIYNEVSSELLREVLMKQPKTPDETLAIIDHFKIASKGSRVSKIRNNQPFVAAASNVSYSSDSSQRSNVCFKCHRVGHYARSCPIGPDYVDNYRTRRDTQNRGRRHYVSDKFPNNMDPNKQSF
ncbi:trichohyalin [Biomphalaria glabrata]|nr:trichohyalin [Biomphalaria glabrata]KAI8791178.1 trichohyalin [Biomphalaria glabrata]KAI8795830.1 trichohyalin [Biomphalaria glabrata]